MHNLDSVLYIIYVLIMYNLDFLSIMHNLSRIMHNPDFVLYIIDVLIMYNLDFLRIMHNLCLDYE